MDAEEEHAAEVKLAELRDILRQLSRSQGPLWTMRPLRLAGANTYLEIRRGGDGVLSLMVRVLGAKTVKEAEERSAPLRRVFVQVLSELGDARARFHAEASL